MFGKIQMENGQREFCKGGFMYGRGICENPKGYTWNKTTTIR